MQSCAEEEKARRGQTEREASKGGRRGAGAMVDSLIAFLAHRPPPSLLSPPPPCGGMEREGWGGARCRREAAAHVMLGLLQCRHAKERSTGGRGGREEGLKASHRPCAVFAIATLALLPRRVEG